MKRLNLNTLFNYSALRAFAFTCCLGLLAGTPMLAQTKFKSTGSPVRQRIFISEDWRFFRYDLETNADSLIYDVRPGVKDNKG